MKVSILQENITTLNVYVSNNRASKYVRQNPIGLQGEINKSTITVVDINTSLSEIQI